MTSEVSVTDDELESLMAELEAQNAEIAAAAKAAEPKPSPSIPDREAITTPHVTEALEGYDGAAIIKEEGEKAFAKIEAEPVTQQASEKVIEESAAAAPDTTSVTVEIDELHTAASVDASDVSAAEPLPEPPLPKVEPKRPTETTGPAALNHYVDVDQFRSDTRVTDINLDKCMIEQNGLRAYYGAQAAYAEAQHARLKAKFEVVEATLYDHHRKNLTATGEKVTEKMVENAVKLDSRWLKAKNMVIEAETIASINKSLVESLKDRRDMIIQLGADRRDEYKGAARVLAEQNERDDLRGRAIQAAQGK